jgi:hypothetical protein
MGDECCYCKLRKEIEGLRDDIRALKMMIFGMNPDYDYSVNTNPHICSKFELTTGGWTCRECGKIYPVDSDGNIKYEYPFPHKYEINYIR